MVRFDLDSRFVKELDADLLALVAEGVEHWDEQRFLELARREFTFQYHANPVYQQYCQARGVTPGTIKSWADIPALPVRYFKEQVISSVPLDRANLQYMSSGTTGGEHRTRVHRDERCTELVYAANRQATKAYLFPDVDRLPILLFVPSPEVAPFMGMAIGLTVMKDSFGTEESRYLIGPDGLDTRTMHQALSSAEETGRPLALVGATSGFVFLFRQLAEQSLRYHLPAGSRIADGGGYLGSFGECTRDEYLAKCWEYLGVPPEFCVNTLGMAECGQNYLDNVLRAKVVGRPAPLRYKPNLPWTRVIAVDPETGRRRPRGERGQLCHYDLTNRASVLGVLTDNIGYEVEDGFEIIGRAQGAPADLPAGHAQAMAAGMLGSPCSAGADQLLGQQCQAVAERMLAAGAPRFAVEMVKRRMAAGKTVHHPGER
jgi:hypothetical protein